jgi:hypothetical protein
MWGQLLAVQWDLQWVRQWGGLKAQKSGLMLVQPSDRWWGRWKGQRWDRPLEPVKVPRWGQLWGCWKARKWGQMLESLLGHLWAHLMGRRLGLPLERLLALGLALLMAAMLVQRLAPGWAWTWGLQLALHLATMWGFPLARPWGRPVSPLAGPLVILSAQLWVIRRVLRWANR